MWDSTADRFEMLGRIMYFDFCTYLRALLVKIDRATMLASLESRAPYLHQPLARFAFALPDALRTRGLRTKPLLKAMARRYLPRGIVARRKRGLSVPISRLMRSELRAEFDRHVRDERFEQIGLLPTGRVGELVSEHTAGRANHARALWTLLVLGLWTEQWTGA
jgi:asparagine synthase (glutamine-hydrolysing)